MGTVKLLKASAGSGKTFRLVYEYIRNVMEDPPRYRHILAVTFTNKATAEMKRRIVEELSALASGGGSRYAAMLAEDLGMDADAVRERAARVRTLILHDYSRFAVLTIDKFFQRIIRSFIRELGIDPGFALELSIEPLLSRAADMLIDESGADPRLRRWITAVAEENIGQNKKWNIKEELVKLGEQIFRERFLAGGGGRPGDEAEAVAEGAIRRERKIKEGLRESALQALEIIASAGLTTADFSGGRNSFANYFRKIAEGNFEMPGASVVKALESESKWYAKDSPARDAIIGLLPRLMPLLEQICRTMEASETLLNSVAAMRRNYLNSAVLGDLSRKVEEIARRQGVMPISETNAILNRLVAGNDTPFIFEKTGNNFTHYMMDEFQDTSRLQWENFVPLLRNALAQSDAGPVFAVGDVKQSIYRWRGGDWGILASGVAREFGRVDEGGLTENYRSLPLIVEFNNAAVSACVEADNRELNEAVAEAAAHGRIPAETSDGLCDMLARAYENHSQKSVRKGEGHVTIAVYPRDAEGKSVPPLVAKVEELQERGYAPGDIAILVRRGEQGVRAADMLLERKRTAPGSPYSYDVVTQEALLIDSSPAVRFVAACFGLAASPSDGLSAAVFDNYLATNPDGGREHGEFLAALALMSPQEAFEAVYSRFGLQEREQESVYLQAFHEQILDFTVRTSGDIAMFARWWSEEGGSKSVNLPQERSAITVITVHKAKGLQYRAVIIPWCDWRLDPKVNSVFWATDRRGEFAPLGAIPVNFTSILADSAFADDYWEEKVLSHIDNVNLFYVAATRAEEELHIMIPESAVRTGGNIGSLLMKGLKGGGSFAALQQVRTSEGTATDGTERICFGTPRRREQGNGGESTEGEQVAVPYISYSTEGRLRLRMPSGRYGDETPDIDTARGYGTLMHKVLESAVDIAGLEAALSAMVADGLVPRDGEAALREAVESALTDPLVRSWFDGSWDRVRTESEIILPGSARIRRPDRVMLRGDKAVVVDYKFGENRPASHRRQVESYARHLKAMGYRDVEAYLWYFSLGEIESIV